MTPNEQFMLIMDRFDRIETQNRRIEQELFNKIRIKEIIRIDMANQREVLQIVDMHESPDGVRVMVK